MIALDDTGRLLLRLTLGVLLLFHGVHKVLGGLDGVEQMLAGAGLPDAFAYGAYIGEVVGPILIILGVFTRIGALIIALNMIAAVAIAKTSVLFAIGPEGGYALELEAFYFLTALAVAMLGAGRYALGTISPLN